MLHTSIIFLNILTRLKIAPLFYNTCQQLNYSVEFAQFVFIKKQLKKFKLFINKIKSRTLTYFIAKMQIYIFFFTCKINYGMIMLKIAN